jgi:hypothetical protein
LVGLAASAFFWASSRYTSYILAIAVVSHYIPTLQLAID